VLVVNDGTLPLNLQTTQRLAVVGELARTPRYQGAAAPRSTQREWSAAGGPDSTS
jgi:beta-glucosidase